MLKNATMLKESFTELLTNYTNDQLKIDALWHEIEENYSSSTRHYHTLQHLEHLINQLSDVKAEVKNWDVILFTLFYHDVIYDVQNSDNEEMSAELAEKRMKQLGVPGELIAFCKAQIMATKSHVVSSDNDTNYFTDADLSILGQSWDTYSVYAENVRKEYAIYPDSVYNPGRKKVLHHFLEMNRIFKTAFFYHKFEAQAKRNLQTEIELL